MLENVGILISIISIFIAVIGVLFFISRNYVKVPPSVAAVVTGGRAPRFVVGGAFFRIPLVNRVDFLSLNTFQVAVRVEKAPNIDGVKATIDAIANLTISNESAALMLAAQRFLGQREETIRLICAQTLEGLLRQLVGKLTIEEMVKSRESIAQGFMKDSSPELAKMGVLCDNFVFKKLEDDEGYIEALGKKKTAEVKRDATIGEAEAGQEATERSSAAKQAAETARLGAEQMIAEAQRNLSLRQAEFKKEVGAKEAEADMARKLREAEINRELKTREIGIREAEAVAMIKVTQQQAAQKEQELLATTIRPAEAQREAAVIKAEGEKRAALIDAEATKARAEAEKTKLTAEGEGRAAAEAAQARMAGLAHAEADRAKFLAEADGVRAKGEAEGAAIKAKLLAEAEGLSRKNEALADMSDGAKLILIVEAAPGIIEKMGEAGERVGRGMSEPIGHAISRIDDIRIFDMGGGQNGQGSSLERFAGSVPAIAARVAEAGKAMGIDITGLLGKAGIKVGDLFTSGHRHPTGAGAGADDVPGKEPAAPPGGRK